MVDVGQQLETLTFNDGGYPDVQFVVPDGAKGIYRELSEFVLYFWRRVPRAIRILLRREQSQ